MKRKTRFNELIEREKIENCRYNAILVSIERFPLKAEFDLSLNFGLASLRIESDSLCGDERVYSDFKAHIWSSNLGV